MIDFALVKELRPTLDLLHPEVIWQIGNAQQRDGQVTLMFTNIEGNGIKSSYLNRRTLDFLTQLESRGLIQLRKERASDFLPAGADGTQYVEFTNLICSFPKRSLVDIRRAAEALAPDDDVFRDLTDLHAVSPVHKKQVVRRFHVLDTNEREAGEDIRDWHQHSRGADA